MSVPNIHKSHVNFSFCVLKGFDDNKTMSKHKKQSVAELIEPYPGEWVALTADHTTMLAHSNHLKSALKQAHQSGEKFPYMIKAPDEWTAVVIF